MNMFHTALSEGYAHVLSSSNLLRHMQAFDSDGSRSGAWL